jgi:anti-sigma B factor antagonist
MIASIRPSLTTETIPDGPELVTLDGEFDISHTPQIGYRLSDILGQCDGDVVVDLRGVCFLDSRMMRTLSDAFREADQRSCQLVLVRPNPNVWRVFEVGGLSDLFPSFQDLRDALGHLAAAA